MKKIVSVIICFVIMLSFPVSTNAEELPDVSAETYVLYCADNGEIIASKDENKRMRPASTTKLMTTLLTLEQAAKGNKTVTFTQDMVAEGSSMYLKLGEKVKLSDLAVGMMMSSGNDAANAAAISISGSAEDFSELMNKRAEEIGMKGTHFITPSGLDDDNHYSTAYDLALLMAEGMKNEDFKNLTSQKNATVDFIEPSDKRITYSNHNRLLSLYEYCIGGKTGYTMAAGRCLVSAAEKDGLTLICVTLNDRNDWKDHEALYEYGFSQLALYRSPDSSFCADVPLAGGESESIMVMGDSDFSLVTAEEDKDKIVRKVYLDSFLYAPVNEDDIVGKIEYFIDGESVGGIELKAAQTVAQKKVSGGIFQKIKEFFKNG